MNIRTLMVLATAVFLLGISGVASADEQAATDEPSTNSDLWFSCQFFTSGLLIG